MNFKIKSLNISMDKKYKSISAYDDETVDYLKGNFQLQVLNFPLKDIRFVHIEQEFPIDYISEELQDELLNVIKKIEKELNAYNH